MKNSTFFTKLVDEKHTDLEFVSVCVIAMYVAYGDLPA